MTEPGWAERRRRQWSAPRIAAAVLLHLLALVALRAAIDHIEMPRAGQDRETTLVNVTLRQAEPPPRIRSAQPAPRPAPRVAVHHETAAAVDAAHAITVPAPDVATVAPAVTPPASTPPPDRAFLDSAATRQAIRDVARGTLATRANAQTHEDPGSELVAADGSHTGEARHLPPPPPAQLLAQGIAAAHNGDCGKGEYLGGGMGLLSAPFLLVAEARGKCAHKL